MGTLAIVTCAYCQHEEAIAPGDLPNVCPACRCAMRKEDWRYLLPSEVKERIAAYVASLETTAKD